jgi:hypothetical protein
VLTAPNGQPLPAGSQGRIEGGEAFVVGYDGVLGEGSRFQQHGLGGDGGTPMSARPSTILRANEQVVIPAVCQ